MLGSLADAWGCTPSEAEDAPADDWATMVIYWRVQAALAKRAEDPEGSEPEPEMLFDEDLDG